MTGAGLGHRNKLVAMLQPAHREIFNRTAAHIFQQRNRRFQRYDAVRRAAAERTGGDLHHSRRTGWRHQAVNHGFVLPQQRAAGRHAGKYLVDVLRLHLTRNFADHRRLVRVARAQSHGERVINPLRVFTHIGNRAGDVRVIFGEHAHQYMTFRRLINLAGVLFAPRQHVQADAVTIKIRGQFHAFFSLFKTSAMRRETISSCCAFTLRTSASIMPSFAL